MVGTILDIRERKELKDRLKRLATTDSLTGLLNRRDFSRRVDQEIRRMLRHNTGQACLLMINLDHFKQVNDTCGHGAGNRVLTSLSQKLLKLVRVHDLAGRLGGEEFAVLLVEPDVDQGGNKAEQILQMLEDI